jgi:hypothetical protein
MGTPNEKYNSGRVPHGGFFVDIYRPADAENPNAGGTKLGRYLVEVGNPSASSTVTKRPGTDGGKGGWFIVEGDTEGPATIQRNIATTPTVANGDYFDASFRIDAAGAVVPERFVIHTPDHERGPGYRKQSVTVIVDDYAEGLAASDSQSAQ